MGWFDEQIRQRIDSDNSAFEESFSKMADSILGTRLADAFQDNRLRAQNAIGEILHYFHIHSTAEVPNDITDVNEQLEYLMHPHGIMHRVVRLPKGWYKDAVGPLLGIRSDTKEVIALLPSGLRGYSYYDASAGKWIKVRSSNASLISEEGICFYHPLPLKKIGIPDLFRFMIDNLSVSDFVFYGILMLAATLIGLFEPRIYNYLVGDVIKIKNETMLLAISAFFFGTIISKLVMNTASNLVMSRIQTKIDLSVVSATMMRILHLPVNFFRKFSSGELYSRTESVSTLCSMLISALLSTSLSAVFSLINITMLFHYAPTLVVPALVIILATFVVSMLSALLQQSVSTKSMELSAKETGMNYSMLTGVQKLKLAAAEKRVFARWADLYAKESKLLYNPSAFLVHASTITLAVTLVGDIVLMQGAISSGLDAASWAAFQSAFGMISGAFTTLSSIALTIAKIKPVLEMVKPILDAEPELSGNGQQVTRLNGGIEMNHVTFRYEKHSPKVIDDLSLKINPGQYVAICGTTGCGKSTLIRLLLGFEKPLGGAIYYDGRDISSLDLSSLRRKIGVVMQDGKLMQGDIYSNIVVSAPQLTIDAAWEAAELAGIADDIRAMPMGMFTILSEGSGGISGGQKQRLMIARAVAPKPKILIFDEATSALDNITQRQISEALDRLKCTRIVVAHRLSTIRQCDRIIVLDGGHIIEDGTYEELVKKDGFFADLVRRQQVDTPSQRAAAQAAENIGDAGENAQGVEKPVLVDDSEELASGAASGAVKAPAAKPAAAEEPADAESDEADEVDEADEADTEVSQRPEGFIDNGPQDPALAHADDDGEAEG